VAGPEQMRIETRVHPDATYTVKCTCGFACDSHAASGAEAIAEFIHRHKCPKGEFSFEALRELVKKEGV